MPTLAPQFTHAYEALPGLLTAVSSDYSAWPHLLFAQVDGDLGLRHAVRYYWDAKSITVTVNGRVYDYTPPSRLLATPPMRAAGWAYAGMELGTGDGWGSPPGDLGGFSAILDSTVVFFTDLQRYAVGAVFDHPWGQPGGEPLWADWSRLCPVAGAEGTAFAATLPSWAELPAQFGFFYGGETAESVAIDVTFWTYD